MDEIAALGEVSLTAVQPPKAIWRDDTVVIEAVHKAAFDDVTKRRRQLKTGGARRNIVLEGRPGAGKSHFLGRVRRETVAAGDLFIVLQLSQVEGFWRSLASAYIEALYKDHKGGTQLKTLLSALCETAELSAAEAKPLLAGEVREGRLMSFKLGLKRVLGRSPQARDAVDVAICLVLFNSTTDGHDDIALSLIEGHDLDEDGPTIARFRTEGFAPMEVVRALDTLASACGLVTVAAVDQVDSLIAVAEKALADGDRSALNIIANDLMQFAETAENTIIILSCLRSTWALIEREAIQSAKYRFEDYVRIGTLPSADCGVSLISEILAREYARIGFSPPYATWPIQPAAFSEAQEYTPRALIIAVESHIRACVAAGRVGELGAFSDAPPADDAAPDVADTKGDNGAIEAIDARFQTLKEQADPKELRLANNDNVTPYLVSALTAFIGENGDRAELSIDEISGPKPHINARLRQVIDPQRADEVHWSFRAITQSHGTAQLARLQAAADHSGVMVGAERHLTLIRNTPWSKGAKFKATRAEVEGKGGRFVAISEPDRLTMIALHGLLNERPAGFGAWLRARRPASQMALLADIDVAGGRASPAASPSAPPPGDPGAGGSATSASADRSARPAAANGSASPAPETKASNGAAPAARPAPAANGATEPEPAPDGDGPAHAENGAADIPSVPDGAVLVGTSPAGAPMTVTLESLRKHVVFFGGSGSGKTVALRRLVEACALRGVSAIVLDINNDLARLGMPADTPSPHWLPGDDADAARYGKEVAAVVYTPRINTARPIAFAPLAGLPDLVGDPDEFPLAVDNAVALIAPKARLSPTTTKGDLSRAVLREAISAYARMGHASLPGLFDYLADLPEGVSALEDSAKIAADMAQALKAASVNDPMFGDVGTPMDPGRLFTPPAGKRAVLSIISFIGLPNADQQQQFVSQLQMALFSWIKKNPAPADKPLCGLLVMDEAHNFAASSSASPSLPTTLALASQARKYGLGLIFATKAPKQLHNQIAGNCATQVFGRLGTPAQIDAAKDLAAARGGGINGIAKLVRGEFFIAREGRRFERVNVPFCLTKHPPQPLAPNEVRALATGA
ncbi:MAG: type IV secretion system DNA-binding domain-containing protein [Pseudomonadota bacterium]